MKKLKNKYITIFAAVLFIGLAGGLGYYLNQGRSVLVTQRKTITNLRQEATDMDALTRQFREFEPKISGIGKTVPATTVDIASFLQEVNNSASISGTKVTLRVTDIKDAQKSKEGQKVDVQITITGSYINTTKIINRISNLPYYFQVRQVSVKLDRQGGLITTFTIDLITSYET